MAALDGSPGELLASLVADPGCNGIGRLAARPLLVPLDGVTEPVGPPADAAGPTGHDASPWWRSLDGTWQFAMLERPGDLTLEHVAPGPAPAGGATIEVPGAWSTQFDAEGRHLVQPHYTNVVMPFDAEPPETPAQNPTGVYRRVCTVPREWKGRRVVLRIGAAESLVALWVDGHFVGAGTDSRLPNEFDLTDRVRPGRRCTVVAVVVRWCAHSWVEDQDQWWHGGIQRSVALWSPPASHVSDLRALPGRRADGTGTLDVTAHLDGPLRREPGWTVQVSVHRRTARGGRGRVVASAAWPVPVWDASSEAAQLIGSMFVEPGVVRGVLEVPDAEPWTHETPTLHHVELRLVDPDGTVVDQRAFRTGFRSVEVRDRELLINGQPVLLHGVNLHEHDPRAGRSVSVELTRRDLLLMKAHNLNAVRAAHYPHDEHLAELCDELGLYLVDEANVESHGRQASLCHDRRFDASVVERVQRMVLRDNLHPSVIVWSLGNEAGDGAAHAAAAAWVRHHDPSRPVQYEGPFMHDLYAAAPVSDVVCPMYSSIDDIVRWADTASDLRRPLVLCEYSHAMGNSNGSLADYWDAFESTPGLQGGFIWEWVEHGLVDPDAGPGPDGRVSWRYGGDFGDVPNDTNFVCDGLVSADREPHPAMAEVHWVGRPVRVGWADDAQRRLRVTNRRWFRGLDDLRCRWALSVDGEPVASGELEVPDLAPRAEVALARPCTLPRVPTGAECHLTLRWSTRRATAWAPAGHEVAHDQLELRPSETPARSGRSTVAPAETIDGVEPVPVEQLPWRPTVVRALTDNDGLRQGWMRGYIGNLARWIDQQGLDRCEWLPGDQRRRRAGDAVRWSMRGELVPPGPDGTGAEPVQVRRRVESRLDGWHHVECTLELPASVTDPPRIGTEWELPDWLERVEYVGDGPLEHYPDRRSAAVLGRHELDVQDSYVDYVVPQEHGHRGEVRWLSIAARRRRSGSRPALLIVSDPGVGHGTVGMAVRRHSDAELWACTHTDELVRLAADRGARTVLYLDVAQRGLGTASCGPDTLERYRIAAGVHRLSTWWCWYDRDRVDPGVLARRIRHRVG